MVKEGEGRVVKRNKVIYVRIPAKVTKDDDYDYRVGEKVSVILDDDGNLLARKKIRKTDSYYCR